MEVVLVGEHVVVDEVDDLEPGNLDHVADTHRSGSCTDVCSVIVSGDLSDSLARDGYQFELRQELPDLIDARTDLDDAGDETRAVAFASLCSQYKLALAKPRLFLLCELREVGLSAHVVSSRFVGHAQSENEGSDGREDCPAGWCRGHEQLDTHLWAGWEVL